jgi:hypothetical protein
LKFKSLKKERNVSMSITRESILFHVDPARLADGEWDHRIEKYIGEGDMASSYSADRIAEARPIRRPFTWQGSLWVCVGSAFRQGVNSLSAYRLTPVERFSGTPTTYSEKTIDGEAARNDPNGFYHGMQVTHAGKTWVLCGPGATFVAGQAAQMSLFSEP